ncbi:YegP family protein [Herminiimonas sp. CN]|uniref:YegP family protein n=1 Tax=Herminiimonas sp. CN TaxID=1349818 RepID=UPI0004741430|nr:YegP family protein [Herminiimonas sp. CN]
MAGKYVLKNSTAGKFSFKLVADNDQILFTSETYESKAAALNGIASCQKNGSDDKHFERKSSTANQPYFVLKAANGQIIGKSQMYSSTAAMENEIALAKANATSAVEDNTQ